MVALVWIIQLGFAALCVFYPVTILCLFGAMIVFFLLCAHYSSGNSVNAKVFCGVTSKLFLDSALLGLVAWGVHVIFF